MGGMGTREGRVNSRTPKMTKDIESPQWEGSGEQTGGLPIQTADQRPAASVPLFYPSLIPHALHPASLSRGPLPPSPPSHFFPFFLSPSLPPTLFQGPSFLLPPFSAQHSWLTLCLSSLRKPLPISLLLFMSYPSPIPHLFSLFMPPSTTH